MGSPFLIYEWGGGGAAWRELGPEFFSSLVIDSTNALAQSFAKVSAPAFMML